VAEAGRDRLLGEIEHAKAKTTCPTCGQSTVEIGKGMVARLKKDLATAQKALETLKDRADTAGKAEAAAKCGMAELQKAVDAHIANSARMRAVELERRGLESQLTGNAAAAEAAVRLPGLDVRGRALSCEAQAAEGLVSTRRKRVADLEMDNRTLAAQRAEAASRARTEQQFRAAQAVAAVEKGFVALLEAMQTELLQRSVGGLLARVNELCAPLLPHPLEYRDGELLVGGRWSHRSASDSEKLTIYTALSLALAAESPVRIATLGRFESFDGVRQGRVVDLARELIRAGKLDQCLLVEVSHNAHRAAEWTAAYGDAVTVVEVLG